MPCLFVGDGTRKCVNFVTVVHMSLMYCKQVKQLIYIAMSANSQDTLSQSKKTIAKTPPLTQTPIITTAPDAQTPVSQQQERKTQEEHKQKLQVNNSLFGQNKNKTCEEERTTRNVENALKTEKNSQESKDNNNDNVNENDINIIVPSFIRLFVIKRIIDKYIKNNKNKKQETKEEIIKKLANGYKDDKKIESLVINILTQLINDGIKKYMDNYYNEHKHANIIEDIFGKIILEKFGQDYNEMIKYGRNNDNYCQNLLFSSSDLMSEIFQYLEWGSKFDEDLYSCSLVSSHWLYHVWNVNSVYYINLYNLFGEDNHNSEKNTKWARMWQRLCYVKAIEIDFCIKYSEAALARVNKLSMFRKVEKVNLKVCGASVNYCMSVMIPIMRSCKDRVKYCQTKIFCRMFHSSDLKAQPSPSPSPLRLPKAQYVEIGDLYFYRIWTNECTQLKLVGLNNNINKDWCKFVIENCDCSNISNLMLCNVTFDNNSINQVILKQFALKFYNLKTLEIEIEIDDKVDNVLLFWQLLKPIISKNKSKVKLKVSYLKNHHQAIFLSERMDKKDLEIVKLNIGGIRSDSDDAIDGTIKLIQERDNRGLNHLAIEHPMSDDGEGKKILDELKCKSITIFEVKGYNIQFVNQLLEWKMIAEKQIFVIVDVFAYYREYDNSNEVLSLFKQLYENVYKAFMQQIAIDIKIKVKEVYVKDSKVFKSHLSLYSSYFENSQFLSKYNKPNCNNNLCLPHDKPLTYFYINDPKKDKRERYFTFSATNVRMK